MEDLRDLLFARSFVEFTIFTKLFKKNTVLPAFFSFPITFTSSFKIFIAKRHFRKVTLQCKKRLCSCGSYRFCTLIFKTWRTTCRTEYLFSVKHCCFIAFASTVQNFGAVCETITIDKAFLANHGFFWNANQIS